MTFQPRQGLVMLLSLLYGVSSISATPLSHHIHFTGPQVVTANSVQNIHIEYLSSVFSGHLHMVYGDCSLEAVEDRHHSIGSTVISTVTPRGAEIDEEDERPTRFVWVVPEDAAHKGCLHAYSGSELVGRSSPVEVVKSIRKRESIADVADPEGRWFDGVAYMKSKNESGSFVASAKSKKIAILGGGMAGLMTSFMLQSIGVENWHIMESSQRVGGRIRTKYLNGTTPSQYQYQEMGPMRFPVSTTYAGTGETIPIKDHQLVFQLAEVLNLVNKEKHPELAVNFIPWIQSSPNTPANSNGARLPNGQIPSSAQIKADPSLMGPAQVSSNDTAAKLASDAFTAFMGLNATEMRLLATDVFAAHRKAVNDGIFDWSEAAYLRYKLGYATNITDFVAGPLGDGEYLFGNLYDSVYFGATTWRTIDKGLESLPRAMLPHVVNKTTFGRYVSGLTYKPDTKKIAVNWREANERFGLKTESEEYDYAVVAVPFSKVRLWRLPPYSSLLSRAINTMNYQQSCKIALHYETRFWEHLSPPIIGGCGGTDIPGIGSICYPSYTINATGPGVILASYTSGVPARSVAALSTADHVALAQRAVIEAHGSIAAEQYTGNFERQCWEVDEHQAGAWAAPLVGQEDLYLPAYFQTEMKTIFIGEHTSYTHAWIFSALESAVRGTAQLLLDMGLVDEARTITTAWLGRWIYV